MTQPALDTSLHPARPYVPEERAVLPVAQDLMSELTQWIGARVSVMTPGYKGSHDVHGMLAAVLKGQNGEPVLKLEVGNRWREGEKSIPSIHLIPWSKVLEFSRAKS